ncbi:MAG: hypothetical protein K0R38_605 [Polyangiaceae bacterium]|jgi:ribosomal protein L7Ae-like RNA K-turn-binding protein|nr:hypothetical protein [Polyangiaceae bacterium]
MTKWRIWIGVLVAGALSASASRTGAEAPACVEVAAEARLGAVGYDHIVALVNTCRKNARCVVATDVNPEAVTVNVARNSQVEVVTFRGSPARTFIPRVTCRITS